MQLDEYQNTKLPNDWKVTGLLDDVIMVEFSDGDGDNVERDGVYIPVDVSKSLWRVGIVRLMGPKCSPQLKVGDHILFPNDKGIRAVSVENKTKYVFINEQRIFGIVKSDKAKDKPIYKSKKGNK
jgi:co-chaperonin GroES (HSP10)